MQARPAALGVTSKWVPGRTAAGGATGGIQEKGITLMSLSRILAVALLALALCLPALAAENQAEAFTGTYDWKQGGKDELSAEFTPEGEDSWKVRFSFRWDGESRTWQGTAKGSLEDGGKLSGTATSGGREWEFEAKVSEGVMRGSHTELKNGGKRYDTGSFEISR
jgi:hypothetical protein